MSISSVQSTSSYNYTNRTDQFAQVRSDFLSLGTALQSGDLKAAQAAFTKLQTDAPGIANQANAQGAAGSSTSDNFATLASALQSGDLSGAQKAFAAIQQAAPHGRHHHHHGGTAATSSGLGQDFQSLASALQTGDLSGAQNAFSAIQQTQQAQDDSPSAGDGKKNGNFQTLATALQSGDLKGAQQAFAAFLQAHREQNGLPVYSAAGASANGLALPGDLIDTMA